MLHPKPTGRVQSVAKRASRDDVLPIGSLIISALSGAKKRKRTPGSGQGESLEHRRRSSHRAASRHGRAPPEHGNWRSSCRAPCEGSTARPGIHRDVQVGDTLAKGTSSPSTTKATSAAAKAGRRRASRSWSPCCAAKNNLEIATRKLERYANSAGSVSRPPG